MDALNAFIDKMMQMMAEERAQRLATEETLRQNQSPLDATAGQQNPTPTQPILTPAPSSNPIVLAKPQPFDGTRRAAAKVLFCQIGLHAITYPKRFRNVVFAMLMKDYAATWSQPYQQSLQWGTSGL
ncbi:uncharacterized protein VP01_531g12 [Puccinia sorghi]|uniref:DUF4939 domain-containing protein n=1 Tax=Puccinia sorghi TaxID=27349 RepID=A0A0L6UK73_9BASI|nr:uncharacterized protein VP01_531g12 [Puccinia sorghi]